MLILLLSSKMPFVLSKDWVAAVRDRYAYQANAFVNKKNDVVRAFVLSTLNYHQTLTERA
jgi:hypothetical protein